MFSLNIDINSFFFTKYKYDNEKVTLGRFNILKKER
jgi:hypothetical protein